MTTDILDTYCDEQGLIELAQVRKAFPLTDKLFAEKNAQIAFWKNKCSFLEGRDANFTVLLMEIDNKMTELAALVQQARFQATIRENKEQINGR